MANVYEIVTERILDQLKKGVVPWKETWKSESPRNISGRPYHGINLLLLGMMSYCNPYWLTFKQISELGGKIKKGEHASIVVYWNVKELENESEEKDNPKKQFLLFYYRVFNFEQCEFPDEIVEKYKTEKVSNFNSNEKFDEVLNSYKDKPKIIHSDVIRSPYYSPSEDIIKIHNPEKFNNTNYYYSALSHELIHSTGHESRLDRKLKGQLFDEDKYSKEELIAEIGACFIKNICNIKEEDNFKDSVSYINSWIEKLKNDHRLIVHASNNASKAVDYMLDKKEENL